MTLLAVSFLAALILLAAMLYASVGQAGASGYLAAMALFSIAPTVMKPTALALNILVATITTIKFYRANCFSWPVFWPFALTSVPFSFFGGTLSLPGSIYKPIVGIILIFAAYRLFIAQPVNSASAVKPIPLWAAFIAGAVIGLLSGLTGVGGGIFLSPLLLFMGWAETKQTSGVSAAFILVNSVAGIVGHRTSITSLPSAIPVWAIAAVIGGWIGAEYGSRRIGSPTIRRLLAVVLVIAGLKMIFA